MKFIRRPAKKNLNEQSVGTWVVTTRILDHVNHTETESNLYSQSNKIHEEDKEFISLMRARTNAKNITDVQTEQTGKCFKAQNV